MHLIFVTGTAGSGKSTLASQLPPWYAERGAHAVTVNLDPGAINLPYAPQVDIRDYIDLQELMETYHLGPNGGLVLAADITASRIGEVQEEIDALNPDYAVIDTPGQMELFAYRDSGPYIVQNLRAEGRAVIFLFDASLVSSPTNFVSTALLASSLQLRLDAPQVPVLSKRDLVGDLWKRVLRWSSDEKALEEALSREASSTGYLLSRRILGALVKTGFAYEMIPVSAVTLEGMVELSATLSRILKVGEEVED